MRRYACIPEIIVMSLQVPVHRSDRSNHENQEGLDLRFLIFFGVVLIVSAPMGLEEGRTSNREDETERG